MNITHNNITYSSIYLYTPLQQENSNTYTLAILLSLLIISLHFNIKSFIYNYSNKRPHIENNNNNNNYHNDNNTERIGENSNQDESDDNNELNSSFRMYSTEPMKKPKKKLKKEEIQKEITITIQHTKKENHIIEHIININNNEFKKWIESFEFYNLNDIIDLIREGSIDTPIQLFIEIKNSQLFSDYQIDWDLKHPNNYSFNKEANIIIKEFFNNKLIIFDEINSPSLINVDRSYLEESSDEEFFDMVFQEEEEKDDDDDEEAEAEAEEIEESFETFYSDAQYIPQDKFGKPFIFTQEQKNDINFMKKNIFPMKIDNQGPSFNLPGYNMDTKSIIDYVFSKFFDDFLKELLSSTNDYLEHVKWSSVLKGKKSPWFCKYSEFTITDLKNYLAIFVFAGLNRITNVYSFWQKPENYTGLSFYNSSIANIMSYQKYKAIHRCIHFKGFGTDDKPTNLNFLYEYVNTLIKSLYHPGGEFSFDDDLFKWTGKGGLKKRIPGKADRVGNILWKLVDSNTYIYHFEIEHLVDNLIKQEKTKIPIGQEILNRTINQLKQIESIENRNFNCFIIDAGLLGSIENMKTLSKNGYYYIISVASNRNGNIFQQFINLKNSKTNYLIGETKYGQNGECTAIAWQCKKNKTFYVLTNIPEPIFKEKEEYLKRASNTKVKKGQYEKKFITTPRVIWLYNNCHNYVDSSKMIINPQRNTQRARTYQRVVFNDCFYIVLYNCWVVVNSFLEKKLLLREFLLHLCNNQFISGSIIQRISRNAIYIPALISDSGKGSRSKCYVCAYYPNIVPNLYSKKPNAIETKCQCHKIQIHSNCNIVFHNPAFTFIFEKKN